MLESMVSEPTMGGLVASELPTLVGVTPSRSVEVGVVTPGLAVVESVMTESVMDSPTVLAGVMLLSVAARPSMVLGNVSEVSKSIGVGSDAVVVGLVKLVGSTADGDIAGPDGG